MDLIISADSGVYLPLSEIHPFQHEMKTLSTENYIKLRREIEETGFSFAVHVWFNDGKFWCLDGHQRIECLKRMGAEEVDWDPLVPIVKVEAKDFKEARRKCLAAASQYGTFNHDGIQKMLESIQMPVLEAIEKFDFPTISLDSLIPQTELDDRSEKENHVPDLAPERCSYGQIWQLGAHRLMCGDSTKEDDVAALLGGQKANICFTSPPYNLGENMKLRGHNASGKDSAYNEMSDHKSSDDYVDFLRKWTDIIIKNCDLAFVNLQLLAGNKLAIPEYWKTYKNNIVDVMVWDKLHGAPAMAPNVLNSCFEFVFILSETEKPSRAIKTADVFRGSVDNIFRMSPRGKKDSLAASHGAVFPVEFAKHFIENFSTGSVIDVFGGSGSTMIAAESLNRKSFTMEIDPKYCDIIIARWERFSGRQADLLNREAIPSSTYL